MNTDCCPPSPPLHTPLLLFYSDDRQRILSFSQRGFFFLFSWRLSKWSNPPTTPTTTTTPTPTTPERIRHPFVFSWCFFLSPASWYSVFFLCVTVGEQPVARFCHFYIHACRQSSDHHRSFHGRCGVGVERSIGFLDKNAEVRTGAVYPSQYKC